MQAPHGPASVASTVSLVTGAGGFVGGHLCRLLSERGCEVRRGPPLLEGDESVIRRALDGVDHVQFLAGIAHEAAVGGDPELMRRVNVEAPVRWLEAADRAGVARFTWVSSIKVLGDVSHRPLEPDDPYRPGDAYARSKVEAERRLLAQPLHTTVLAVVRPPLVYGPGVRGNFAALLRLADSGRPLPTGLAGAPRSLVAVDNLCDLLVRLAGPALPGGIFHVADAEDFTVSDLVAGLRGLANRAPRQLPVPPAVMRCALAAVGRRDLYQRLFEPLQVSTRATRERLGWLPPRRAAAALEDTLTWWRTSR